MVAIPVKRRFIKFHRENPEVFRMFEKFAEEAIRADATGLSSKFIIERIRWERMITTSGAGWDVKKKKPFKIDNRFTPWYARLYILTYPERKDLFNIRQIKKP